MDPARRFVEVFSADGVEWQTFAPHAGLGSGIDTLDETGEDASVRVGGSCGQENRVRMPCQCGDCTANGLLQVLRHPPVILFFKIADGDQPRTGSNSELLLGGRPSNKRSCAVDT